MLAFAGARASEEIPEGSGELRKVAFHRRQAERRHAGARDIGSGVEHVEENSSFSASSAGVLV